MNSYIFNAKNLTIEDVFVVVRRSITSINQRPIKKFYDNGWVEQSWWGDITKHPGYEEFDGT